MTKVRFVRKFDFYPPERGGRVCLSYSPGHKVYSVTRECADQAIAVGAAVPVGEAERKAPSVMKKRAKLKQQKAAVTDEEAISGESD